MATYLNRTLVLLEPPPEQIVVGGSQFGCPVDALQTAVPMDSQDHEIGVSSPSYLRHPDAASWSLRENFPLGFSRLIQHPTWLSHGCNVPCSTTYQYHDWAKLKWDGTHFPEVTCTNPDGTVVNVVIAIGPTIMHFWQSNHVSMIQNRQLSEGVQWAINLGASPQEADAFANSIHNDNLAWDYLTGLMNKAGLLTLQPWISRDVGFLLQKFDLPLHSQYSAIHVRRGDKLEHEARRFVVNYWASQGHHDETNLPKNYIPFVHYLNQWDGSEKCARNNLGEIQIVKHSVYIATDDPIVVKQEIADLPDHIDQNTILWNSCNELKFYFSPLNSTAFHLNGHGENGFNNEGSQEDGQEEDSCFARYDRNIASIADLMILSRAHTFIGDLNSNWGGLIRCLRIRLNDHKQEEASGDSEGLAYALDTRIAFGR